LTRAAYALLLRYKATTAGGRGGGFHAAAGAAVFDWSFGGLFGIFSQRSNTGQRLVKGWALGVSSAPSLNDCERVRSEMAAK
jgi:hypothetical protein